MNLKEQQLYSTSIYYSFVRGDVRRTVDPKGASVRRDYDGMGRLWKVTNETNSAFTRYNFDPNHNYIQSYTTILDSAIANMSDQFYAITVFDGHGRVRTSASDHPGSASAFKGQYNGYDNMGRLNQQSNWTEINGSTWNPAGDDVAGWAWSYQTYDWKGRPLETKNQDTTTRTISYAGCGCAGGQVETITDEGTVVTISGQPQTKKRQQKIYYDVLGRVQKTQLLNWESGTPYSTAAKTYNTRDQVTCIREFKDSAPLQDDGVTCPAGACRKTALNYDGHGRLSIPRTVID